MESVRYITTNQLVADAGKLADSLPFSLVENLAGVYPVPRSGLIPAAVVAARWNLPVLDEARRPLHGARAVRSGGMDVLVVDDSIYRGAAMQRACRALGKGLSGRMWSSCVYASPEGASTVDFAAEVVAGRRYFEWNLFGHQDLWRFAFDLDGVLCHDPAQDDDGPVYEASIAVAKPLFLTTSELGAIVTMRLEKWRAITEAWLAAHRVKYRQLVMCPAANPTERRRLDYGAWKGEQAKRLGLEVFVESDARQAAQIHRTSGLPTICPTNGVCLCR